MRATGLRYIPGVTTLRLDAEACTGCGICLWVCPHAVFRKVPRKVELADADGCMECGACVLNCPEGALTVEPGTGCAWAILKAWLTGEEGRKGCCG